MVSDGVARWLAFKPINDPLVNWTCTKRKTAHLIWPSQKELSALPSLLYFVPSNSYAT